MCVLKVSCVADHVALRGLRNETLHRCMCSHVDHAVPEDCSEVPYEIFVEPLQQDTSPIRTQSVAPSCLPPIKVV